MANEIGGVVVKDFVYDKSYVCDFVRCCNCDTVMLVNCGVYHCPNCNSEGTLTWEKEGYEEIIYDNASDILDGLCYTLKNKIV